MFVFEIIFGLCIMATGLVIRICSMKALGRHYSTILFVSNNQPLLATGIYKKIRHPIYLGDLILYISIGLSTNNYIIFAIMTTISIPTYLLRISDEEKMMITSFGDSYKEYRQKTKKLIPFVY